MKSSIPKAFTKVVHLLSLSLMVSLAGCFRSIQADDFVDARLEAHFSSRGVTGCFVVHDVSADRIHWWNRDRAKRKFRPASTFKIPNALIGVETGAVKDIDEIIPWGGTKELRRIWEHDMNLREAMKVSNVAVFHTVSKRVGLANMRKYLNHFGYGNEKTGDDIDCRFWLEGPLEISAWDQVVFLRKLATDQLPIRPETTLAVREILVFRELENCRIFAKTGWVGPADPQIGWWVGWVQRGTDVYPFALNIDIHEDKDAEHRIPIGLDSLATLGIIGDVR